MTTSSISQIAPIALFVYNRLEHTGKTLDALKKNNLSKDSELFVFSDGAKESSLKEVDEVRKYIKTIDGFKKVTVIERPENLGLAKSIIAGVTDLVNRYGRVIVIEDDLVTSPYFLEYMNEGLDYYKDNDKVASIHGYIYPAKQDLPETFFLRGTDCWGWATWKRAWDMFEPDGKKLLTGLKENKLTYAFDFDGSYHFTEMLKRQIEGKNNSWAIRWHASAFLANKLTLYPGKSLVHNIGQDNSGTHKTNFPVFATNVHNSKIHIGDIAVEENLSARKVLVSYFRSLKPSFFQRIIRRLKKR